MLGEVNNSMARLAESQLRMASQKKIEKPSDSPGDLQALLAAKDQLTVSAGYRENIESAMLRLRAADSGVSAVYDRLMSAKEAIVRVNGAMSEGARSALAEELENLIKAVVEELNSRDGGEYIFAGTASGAAPFSVTRGPDPDGAVRIQSALYSGNGASRSAEVSATRSEETGVPGDEVAGASPGCVLDTLIGLRRAVLDGSPTAALQDAADAHMSRLDALQVRLGSRISYLSGLKDRLVSADLQTEARRSSLEDTDFTEEVLAQGRRQVEYEAVLSAAARRSKLSLINYL